MQLVLGSNGVLLESLDCRGQFFHVVIVDVGEFVDPRRGHLGKWRHQLDAELFVHGDRVMVVVIPDFLFRLVQCTTYYVLGHVNTGRIGIPCLYCVLAISSNPRPRVAE